MEERRSIFISAGETSGEMYAAEFYKAYKKKHGDVVGFGLGGDRLRALGFEVLRDTRDHLVMGFVEVLHKLPTFKKSLSVLVDAVEKRRPQFGVVVDYPGFHFKLAQKVSTKTKLFYLIPPKVWAWKKSRLEKIPKLFHHVFLVFPFEKKIYGDAGVSYTYLGNPLLYQLPVEMKREEARGKLGLSDKCLVISMMPGSRPAEFRMHIPLLVKAMKEISLKFAGERLSFLVPIAHEDDRQWCAPLEKCAVELGRDLRVILRETGVALRASDAAWVKSGTSSLEAAVCDVPHVVFYKANRISEWIVKNVIKYDKPISLVNWMGEFLGFSERVVEELVLERLSPRQMADSLYPLLLGHSTARLEMLAQFAQIREALRSPEAELSPWELMVKAIDLS